MICKHLTPFIKFLHDENAYRGFCFLHLLGKNSGTGEGAQESAHQEMNGCVLQPNSILRSNALRSEGLPPVTQIVSITKLGCLFLNTSRLGLLLRGLATKMPLLCNRPPISYFKALSLWENCLPYFVEKTAISCHLDASSKM